MLRFGGFGCAQPPVNRHWWFRLRSTTGYSPPVVSAALNHRLFAETTVTTYVPAIPDFVALANEPANFVRAYSLRVSYLMKAMIPAPDCVCGCS
jgi:hypothetical protein